MFQSHRCRVGLLRDPLRAVVPDGHSVSGRRSVSIGDLANDDWIVGTHGHPCHDVTMAATATAGVTPRIVHRTNDWQAMLSLVASGAGVALIPALALDARRRGFVALRIQPQEPARSIYAAVRRGSEYAPHIAAMIRALRGAAIERQGEFAENETLSASI